MIYVKYTISRLNNIDFKFIQEVLTTRGLHAVLYH